MILVCHWLLVSGCWFLVAGSWFLIIVSNYKLILDAGFSILDIAIQQFGFSVFSSSIEHRISSISC